MYRSLVIKLTYLAQNRVDIAESAKCFTRHMKESRSGHMQELKRLGRYLVKNRKCVLTYARQTSDATLQEHVNSDWTGDLLGKKEHDRCDRERRQIFVATHVMFADACCIVKWKR